MSYMPSKESEQVGWSQNFATLISATPTAFGLTAPQATAFDDVNGILQSAWTAATEPTTRTKITIADKDTALKNMKVMARNLVGIIQSTPTVTNGQKEALGITVRKTNPTPLPVPSTSPMIQVLNVNGYQVTLRLRDVERPDSKARPAGTTGACILSYVGPTAPTNVQDWKLEGNAFKPSDVAVTFGDSVEAGSKVWFTAFWFNARGSGPATTPVSTNIQFGGMDKGNIFSVEVNARKAA